jgi:hypothetical protein
MKAMVDLRWFFAAIIMMMSVAACTSMIPAPQTQQQRLALVDVEVTALINTVADMREQGALSDSAFRSLAESLGAASKAMDAAWFAYGMGDYTQTQTKLELVNQLLIQVHAKLKESSQ